MRFKPYPKYKPSGVEWLETMPENWTATKLKRGFEVCLGKMLQPESKSADDTLSPYLRAANIKWEGVDLTDVKEMWFSPAERNQLSLSKGDLLVSEGGDVGRSSVLQDDLNDCYFQNSVNRVRAREDNSTKFLYYWLQCMKDGGYIDIMCNKSTIAHFTAEKVQSVDMLFPSTLEQSAIATFLDRETGKIDTLIAKQEKLIELLKEKRQAIISHAVTKGLNPNVKLKDSGIEWLGEVPEHWGVMPTKRLLEFVTSGSRGWSEHYSDEGDIFLRIGNLTRETIDLDLSDIQLVIPPEGAESERSTVFPGDLLVSITADLGSVAVVSELPRKAYVSQHVALCRPLPQIVSRWLGYALISQSSKNQWHQSGYGGTKIQLSLDDVRTLRVAVPPFDEQMRIGNFLDSSMARIATLIARADRAITLQKEHRTALISAAVTGKIDVREAA